jgi:hypothetical protein
MLSQPLAGAFRAKPTVKKKTSEAPVGTLFSTF